MLNSICLQGRLTADPVLRFTKDNVAVTTVTLAVERSYVKKGQERETDFIEIVAWRKTAEIICNKFKKGMEMLVTGSIQTRNPPGQDQKVTEVFVSEVFFRNRE